MITLIPVVRSQTQSDVIGLLDTLFDTTSVYRPQSRPVASQTDVLNVTVALLLSEMGGIDDKAQTMTTVGRLYCEWSDVGLSWTPASHGDVFTLSGVSQNEIWIPDIIVDNSVNNVGQLEALGYKEKKVRITNTGKVTWEPSIKAITSCDIDVTYYPFDSQLCSMRLTTGSSKNYEVILFIDHSMYGDILFGGFQNDSSWTFEAYSVSWGDNLNGRYVIAYNVLLSRRPTWYLINIIFPVIFLSFTSPVVFLLPVDAGEKMGTSITVLLSFAVYLTIIADFLPST